MIPAPKLLPLLFPQYHAIPEVKRAMMMMMIMMMMMNDDDCSCCGVSCGDFDDKDNIQSFKGLYSSIFFTLSISP